jgi:hypothetical protein
VTALSNNVTASLKKRLHGDGVQKNNLKSRTTWASKAATMTPGNAGVFSFMIN